MKPCSRVANLHGPPSPPMRGRGLKQGYGDGLHTFKGSPPMRGRGLKHKRDHHGTFVLLSPPMRGRGLKQHRPGRKLTAGVSPPMRGRGLKPHTRSLFFGKVSVAPHAGAWIETSNLSLLHPRPLSPPMRGRGLKRICCRFFQPADCRPPCGGVD